MSGHSKFANIKHKKEKNDAAKGKIFTIIGREIAVAVKAGGPDPNSNSKLRDVIAKAKQNNMPNDNIMRSIKKASGELNTVNSIFYYGDALIDTPNEPDRTIIFYYPYDNHYVRLTFYTYKTWVLRVKVDQK